MSCFTTFWTEVTKGRREGDSNWELDVIANSMKLIGNSGYGSLIISVEIFLLQFISILKKTLTAKSVYVVYELKMFIINALVS